MIAKHFDGRPGWRPCARSGRSPPSAHRISWSPPRSSRTTMETSRRSTSVSRCEPSWPAAASRRGAVPGRTGRGVPDQVYGSGGEWGSLHTPAPTIMPSPLSIQRPAGHIGESTASGTGSRLRRRCLFFREHRGVKNRDPLDLNARWSQSTTGLRVIEGKLRVERPDFQVCVNKQLLLRCWSRLAAQDFDFGKATKTMKKGLPIGVR